ncbi:YkvA family protein [Gracilibacillus sp. Marseille-QA3620]
MTEETKETKEPFSLGKYIERAKSILGNTEKSSELLDDANKKSSKNRSSLDGVWEPLQLLFSMFRSYAKGEYTEIPTRSILAIIAAILYFVTPIDVIPDFIFGLGFADDAAVIAFTAKQVKDDLEKYKLWSEKQENTIETPEEIK